MGFCCEGFGDDRNSVSLCTGCSGISTLELFSDDVNDDDDEEEEEEEEEGLHPLSLFTSAAGISSSSSFESLSDEELRPCCLDNSGGISSSESESTAA
jgi:hypothetical protein